MWIDVWLASSRRLDNTAVKNESTSLKIINVTGIWTVESWELTAKW